MAAKLDSIDLCGRKVNYRLIDSKSARKLRVRVGVRGVEVVRPAARDAEETSKFLRANGGWIVEQLERVECFRNVRRPQTHRAAEILFRGEPTVVEVIFVAHRQGANRVTLERDHIIIVRGGESSTPPAKSLENWLRKQAQLEIERQLGEVCRKLKRKPRKVYVMAQRTKWGNCSRLRTLSFNWRLIMAPAYVLKYVVAHEAAHLAVPDHSRKFWLTVQSVCPETERAKQWLSRHGHELLADFASGQSGINFPA